MCGKKDLKSHLFTGRWEFVGFCCQAGQVLQNGLQVGHLPQHVDLVVLQTNGSGGVSVAENHCSNGWKGAEQNRPAQASSWWQSCRNELAPPPALGARLASPSPPGRCSACWRPAARCPAVPAPRPYLQGKQTDVSQKCKRNNQIQKALNI